jgi:hypothetical protein
LQSINNLKQMVLPIHIYHDRTKRLPPAGGEQDPIAELAGMSWRTHLLPFVEKGAIYQKLLNKQYAPSPDAKAAMEWNRPELAKLNFVPFVPPLPGKGPETWHTLYRVFVGNGAAFELNQPLVLGQKDFPDGLANTILIVEAAHRVPWPKPDELPYDPKKPLPKLGGLFADGFHAAFADGAVRYIASRTDERVLRALITRNGGEIIDELPPLVNTDALARAAGLDTPGGSPKENRQEPPITTAKELVALQLAEEFAKDRDGFAQKYGEGTYLRVRGQLRIIGTGAYFVPGKKLPNGESVKISLAIGGLERLGKIRDGAMVLAEGYPSVFSTGLSIQKCRLIPVSNAP